MHNTTANAAHVDTFFCPTTVTNHTVVNDPEPGTGSGVVPPEALGPHDPYTVSADGHYVGNDGFIVPKDFPEFYERFPHYVHAFVSKYDFAKNRADREDRVSDLIIHMMALPATSKYRSPGYNGHVHGCVDRIQLFNPDSAHGANAARFFNFLSGMCRNRLAQINQSLALEPCRRTVPVSSDHVLIEHLHNKHLDTYPGWVGTAKSYADLLDKGILLAEFATYVNKHNPELLPILEVMVSTDTFKDALDMVGINEKTLMRYRARLKDLWDAFDSVERELLEACMDPFEARVRISFVRPAMSPLDQLISENA